MNVSADPPSAIKLPLASKYTAAKACTTTLSATMTPTTKASFFVKVSEVSGTRALETYARQR